IQFQRFQARLQMVRGWPGIDLYPGSALAHRYVYQLAAVLPFSLGWPLYGLALLGIVTLVRCPGWPRLALGAFAVPFLLFMGASRISPPRYFVPLLPVAALAVGAFANGAATRCTSRFARGFAGALAGMVVAYSCALGASLAARTDFAIQRRVASSLTARARRAPRTLPVSVGYPDRWLWYYDGVVPLTEPDAIRWLFMPLPGGKH